jgi:hypothetical protein
MFSGKCFGQALVEVERSHTSPVLLINSTATLTGARSVISPVTIHPGDWLLLAVAVKLDFSALVYLKAHGQMPLYEVWKTDDDEERIPVGIDPKKWTSEENAIETEFDSNDFVLWPTFGGKQFLKTGQYKVEFRDANSKAAKLDGSNPIISEISVNVVP